MKKTLMILLILAGCGSKDTDEAEEAAPAADPPLTASPLGPDPAQLQAVVDRAMPLAIPDAAKAQYRNIRAGAGGTVCGEVSTPAAKGAQGPFRPFLVTDSGIALVSERPAIDFADPDDVLADGWIRWCATPEELRALGPTLEAAAAGRAGSTSEVSALEVPSIEAIPILPPSALPANAALPAEAAPKPKGSEPPPPPRIDSFFNSVQRQQE
jgi:hypothetical protein